MNDSAGTKLEGVEGDVKWFDTKKGFGFITGPEDQDIFVHFSQIEGEGFRVLSDGQRVNYDAEQSDRGWHATRVKVIESEGEGEVTVRPQNASVRSPRR